MTRPPAACRSAAAPRPPTSSPRAAMTSGCAPPIGTPSRLAFVDSRPLSRAGCGALRRKHARAPWCASGLAASALRSKALGHPVRDDAAEIADRLTANIEGVLDALSPGWVSVRGKGYLTAKSPKQLGSFTVNLTGPKRGCWYRFSCRIGGGPMFLVAYLLTGSESPSKADYRDAFQWARRHLACQMRWRATRPGKGGERAAEKRRADRARAERQEEAKPPRKAETAQEVRAQCVPIAGTLARNTSPAGAFRSRHGLAGRAWVPRKP